MKYWLCLSLVFAFGCTPEAPPTIDAEDRKLIDSLYLQQVEIKKPTLDSICERNFDRRVQSAVDSVLSERQQEINAQVKRLNAIKAEQ